MHVSSMDTNRRCKCSGVRAMALKYIQYLPAVQSPASHAQYYCQQPVLLLVAIIHVNAISLHRHQIQTPNMDDHASSDGTSPSECVSSYRSSSPSQDSRRPQQQYRRLSYTHVFPAGSDGLNEGAPTRGEGSAKSRAALRELLHPTASTIGTDERMRLLNNGLQWLLENSTPSSQPKQRNATSAVPLSHEAVGTFNAKNGTSKAVHGEVRNDSGLGSRSTKTWLDDQVNVKTLPPL